MDELIFYGIIGLTSAIAIIGTIDVLKQINKIKDED